MNGFQASEFSVEYTIGQAISSFAFSGFELNFKMGSVPSYTHALMGLVFEIDPFCSFSDICLNLGGTGINQSQAQNEKNENEAANGLHLSRIRKVF